MANLPNVSPIGTERARYLSKNGRNLYFCKRCVKNIESETALEKCRLCNSSDIVLLKHYPSKKSTYKSLKDNFAGKLTYLVIKEHKLARIFERGFLFAKKRA